LDRSETIPDTPDAVEPREFGLKPEFIRAAWLGFVAIILLIVAAQMSISARNDDFDFWRTAGGWADRADSILVGLVPASVGMFMAHRWRLRLDVRGLHRRRFFGWQTWTWEEFREGHIRHDDEAFSFINPADYRWQRKIDLGVLKEENRDYSFAVCLRFWTPPAVEVPCTLSIKTSVTGLRGTTIDMGPIGIDVSGAGIPRSYGWDEVVLLRIVRLEENHPGFKVLRLTLPDRELELRYSREQGQVKKNWTGAGPDVVSAFLERHVSAERIEEAALEGRARTVADVDSRLEDLRNRQREFRMMTIIVAAAGLILLVCTAVDLVEFFGQHPSKSLADYSIHPQVRGFLALVCFYFAPIFLVMSIYNRRKRRRLEQQREQLAAEEF
jgi:hypothetical protein